MSFNLDLPGESGDSFTAPLDVGGVRPLSGLAGLYPGAISITKRGAQSGLLGVRLEQSFDDAVRTLERTYLGINPAVLIADILEGEPTGSAATKFARVKGTPPPPRQRSHPAASQKHEEEDWKSVADPTGSLAEELAGLGLSGLPPELGSQTPRLAGTTYSIVSVPDSEVWARNAHHTVAVQVSVPTSTVDLEALLSRMRTAVARGWLASTVSICNLLRAGEDSLLVTVHAPELLAAFVARDAVDQALGAGNAP